MADSSTTRMTRLEYMAIAEVIRKLPWDRLLVVEQFADRFAKDDPQFDRTRFLAAALWGIERRADRAVAEPDCRSRTRRAPTQAIAVRMDLGH